MRICLLSVTTAFLTVGAWTAVSASGQTPALDLLKKQQNWRVDCMAKGCIASVDILRGVSGDPPNPNDTTQYVSVVVGLDRATRKPSLVMYEVDPHADQKSGIDLLLGHTVREGTTWKIAEDAGGPVRLPFTRCDPTNCKVVFGGSTPDEAMLKTCADWVDRMQRSDHLFLSYQRNGHLYQTAINLGLFKVAYQEMLTKVAEPPPAPGKP